VFWGSGAGEGFGFMEHDGVLIKVAPSAGQAAKTFTVDNALMMLSHLPTECFGTSAWFIHRTMIPQMGTLKIGDTPVYLSAGNVTGPILGYLYGRPVIVSEFCKPLGEEGDVILADLSAYDIATGGDSREETSVHVRFLTDESVFKIVADTNSQSRWAEAIEDLHGEGKTSPFITLQARA
jgi:HK97 family phage major capsid protein